MEGPQYDFGSYIPLAHDEIEKAQQLFTDTARACVRSGGDTDGRVEGGWSLQRPAPWGVASSRWEPSQSGMCQPFSADLAEQPLTPDTPVTTAQSGSP